MNVMMVEECNYWLVQSPRPCQLSNYIGQSERSLKPFIQSEKGNDQYWPIGAKLEQAASLLLGPVRSGQDLEATRSILPLIALNILQ